MNFDRMLDRRGFLAASAAVLTARAGMAAAPACQLVAEQEEGPYYAVGAKMRRDITEAKAGVPLRLRVALVDAKRCTPSPNAALDIWSCDASGVYSGFTAADSDGGGRGRGPGGPGGFGPGGPGGFGPGGPDGPGGRGPGGPGGRGRGPTDDTRFLRGIQLSDKQGIVEFATLFPGWYAGRAIHIHVKVRLEGDGSAGTYAGGHVAHTGQLFFPEEIIRGVAKLEPYAKRLSVHRTTQDEDDIFNSQHGGDGMLKLERLAPRSDADGFLATVTLAIDPEATPAPVDMRGGFGRGRGPGR